MLKPITSYFRQLSNQHLIFLLTILSILVAWRLHYIQHGWVNRDFVLYHEAARLFSTGEWKQGFSLFGWPLYSLLMSGIQKITGIDLHLSAQILTVFLYALTTFSFLTIIHISNGKKITLYCGALILFSASYLTGDVLPMLLRDPGQWAFLLTSIVFFIRFYRSYLWRDALLWQLSAIIAILFRIEAITYLVLLPAVLLTSTNLDFKNRLLLLLKAHSVNITALVLLVMFVALTPSVSMNDLGRLKEVLDLFDHKYSEAIKEFSTRVSLLENVVLKNHFDGLGTLGLTAAFLAMCAFKCASTIGWINTGLCIYGRNKPIDMDANTKKILLTIVGLTILNAFVILMSVFLLVGRYLAPLALVFMLFAAFVLSYLIQQVASEPNKHYGTKFIVGIILTFMALSLTKHLLSKQEGYNFQQDAVTWLKKHTPSSKKVFYDDSKVRYFANEPFIGAWGDPWVEATSAIDNHTIQENEYLVITQHAKHPEREAQIKQRLPEYREIKRFYSTKARKSIVIYQKFPLN